MDLVDEDFELADKAIVALLQATGVDFSAGRESLAETYEYLMNGNWDMTTDFPEGLRNLRFIQEDEFDQHIDDDDDEAPEHDEQIAYHNGHYIFWAN